MVVDRRLEIAALNNAQWCDAVCDAQGRPGEFLEDAWLNRHATPPYYPNLVTLTPEQHAQAQMAQVQALLRGGLAGGWAVKDSFAALDLRPLGFQVAFAAVWLWLSPPSGWLEAPESLLEDVRWSVIQTPEALRHWETAWAGQGAGEARGIFLPDLLEQSGIVFIAAYQAQSIVAGFVANRTEDVVGISNVFVPVGREALFWRGCVRAVANIFPGLPLVDYEHGDDLLQARALGFEEIGPLQVWIWTDNSGEAALQHS